MAKKKQTKTFIVKINECQNSTWQEVYYGQKQNRNNIFAVP